MLCDTGGKFNVFGLWSAVVRRSVVLESVTTRLEEPVLREISIATRELRLCAKVASVLRYYAVQTGEWLENFEEF
jgi:hypothetical protein